MRISDMKPGTVFKTSYGLCIVCKICVQISSSSKPYLSLETLTLHIDVCDNEYEVIGHIGPDGKLTEASE